MSKQLHHAVGPACDMTAIAPLERDAHQALAARLFGEAVQERTELANGYTFRFTPDRYRDVAAFVANELLCCPFFTFVLEVTADRGPIWLRITGDENAKAILQQELPG